MKIKAPVNSLKSAKILAKMGVDEVYVGVKGNKNYDMRVVSFNGRFQSQEGTTVSLNNFEELDEIVRYCHEFNIKVSFTANTRFLSEELNEGYLEYVKSAIKCNVDSIIVGSIGGLILLRNAGIDIPIYSSTYFFPYNKHTIDFFHKMNVKCVVLPTALSLQEIREIKEYINSKNYDIELEVFAQFGCSNISGRCNIPSLPSNFKGYPLLCRALYDVVDNKTGDKKELYPFLEVSSDCSICVIKELMDMGVDCLKILGREKPIDFIGSIAYTYKNVIKKIENGISISDIRKDVIEKAPWWEQSFCKKEACLYSNVEKTKYNV